MTYELLTGQPVFAERTAQRDARRAHERSAATDRRAATRRARAARRAGDALPREGSGRSSADRGRRHARLLETMTSGSGTPAMPPVLLGGPGMFRKALAIYAAAFVVVAIVAKGGNRRHRAPDWVFSRLAVVMALGLPVVLWTGYVQRVTRRAMTATPTFTPGGTPSTSAHGTIATIALRAAPHMSWYRTARGGLYALRHVHRGHRRVHGMRAFGVGPFGSLLATGQFEQRESDSSHRFPDDGRRRLDARPRRQRCGPRWPDGIVGVHARVPDDRSSARSSA